MPIIPADAARVHHAHGGTWTSYVSPGLGSDDLCAWRITLPAGATGVPHRVNHEEVLLVLTGELRYEEGGDASTARPGDVIRIPADTPVNLANPGDTPATAWVTTRSGLVGTFPDGSRVTPEWTR
ncbi:Cupin domain-containing protein [Stackebrandtia albiflava]|uniref:Cupin domain-containing protein n=1 Tax=Stackebrandtia albiflava TaxID=406432 RepID=A0A562VAC8_9ACTN|nr:cupin domain-containing protein [Stackebrandtia albiflava]TWJ14832.1 Cupin domain-containing protein [Stackebrandtia albiflava]